MKNLNFKNMSSGLMTYIGIAGLVVAIGLGAAGLGIAVKNSQETTPQLSVKTPYAYGKATNVELLDDLKEKFWADGTKGEYVFPSEIAVNSKTVVVPSNLWKVYSTAVQTPFQKNTENIYSDNIGKSLAGLENAITIKVSSTTTDLVNAKKEFSLKIKETFTATGAERYTFDATLESGVIKGVGTATTDLFNAQIKSGADLTKWYFLRKATTDANVNGSDAELAYSLDEKTGEVVLLNKAIIAKDTLKTTLTAATRRTSL